ncbi:MAG: hypothetical protein H7A23_26430 [Leptospiraceae bacterium]|nr:hypothetical protein [Leptospiraceae bacterium]
MDQFNHFESNKIPLVVSGSISSSAKEILKQNNINYLDMAGNCFIKDNKGLYIQIEGKKRELLRSERKHKAFNKNGIKLIYALLLNENLVNGTYEEMAKAANISKSTVGTILKDLKEKGYLLQINENLKRLTEVPQLQEKWVHAFNEKLKPSLLRGKFRFLPKRESDWKSINLGADTFWGGEPGANILTGFLSPGEWTIYSTVSKNELLKNLFLVPDPQYGNVSVYNVFWDLNNENFVNKENKIVNPLLIYADLLGTNHSRNFETAQKIYERELSTYFTE